MTNVNKEAIVKKLEAAGYTLLGNGRKREWGYPTTTTVEVYTSIDLTSHTFPGDDRKTGLLAYHVQCASDYVRLFPNLERLHEWLLKDEAQRRRDATLILVQAMEAQELACMSDQAEQWAESMGYPMYVIRTRSGFHVVSKQDINTKYGLTSLRVEYLAIPSSFPSIQETQGQEEIFLNDQSIVWRRVFNVRGDATYQTGDVWVNEEHLYVYRSLVATEHGNASGVWTQEASLDPSTIQEVEKPVDAEPKHKALR